MSKTKLLMVGNGMAGVRTIEEILDRDPDRFDITIIGKEPYPNYNRIMLSNILQNKMTVEETIMNLSLINISEPTRPLYISYAVFFL
uniref:hypothetical protein n=1 Tax=Staphylococcus pseudintermedius TaxID=283734 RepID=UPI0036F2522E